jgi:hypothetical protein
MEVSGQLHAQVTLMPGKIGHVPSNKTCHNNYKYVGKEAVGCSHLSFSSPPNI